LGPLYGPNHHVPWLLWLRVGGRREKIPTLRVGTRGNSWLSTEEEGAVKKKGGKFHFSVASFLAGMLLFGMTLQ
jgi:hypothetical protein